MMTYPGLPPAEQQLFDSRRSGAITAFPTEVIAELNGLNESISEQAQELADILLSIDKAESEQALKSSLAGKIGQGLESLSRFAGFDWRTNIALVGGFAAKEVIVSTLGTAYSMGEVDIEESDSLGKRLQRSSNWNRVVAVSALVFILFYAPCFVTVACIARESSWGWAAFSMAFNTIFAFLLAVLVYQAGMFFQLG